jgi:hypothetical protein
VRSPRMFRRRVRRVNPLRNAREEGRQSIPSLALPTRTSGRLARQTLQPSESGAGPRRMPSKMLILIGCTVYVYGTSSATSLRRRLRPRPCRTIPTSCRCCAVLGLFIVAIVWYIYLLAPLHLYCPFPVAVALGSCGHGVFIVDL